MNKAKTAITTAQKTIGNPSIHVWVHQYSGIAGVINRVVATDIAVDSQGVLASVNGLVRSDLPRLLTWQEAMNYATAIDRLNVGNHLNVKENVDWRRMYLLGSRDVGYVDAAGTFSTKKEDTIPCHNCGVVLPLEFLQVDHHMPQADGVDLHLLKTMRAMGLTTTAASGKKGVAFGANTLSTVTINPRARDRTYNHLLTASPAGKWTTNLKGNAFLSLIVYSNGKTDVGRMCQNSLLNLVPLCAECNRVKSDYIRPML
jgi:hypothetical protein